jgi:hypothetical protein
MCVQQHKYPTNHPWRVLPRRSGLDRDNLSRTSASADDPDHPLGSLDLATPAVSGLSWNSLRCLSTSRLRRISAITEELPAIIHSFQASMLYGRSPPDRAMDPAAPPLPGPDDRRRHAALITKGEE